MRELRAVINRAALLHDDKLLRSLHLPAELLGSTTTPRSDSSGSTGVSPRTRVGDAPQASETRELSPTAVSFRTLAKVELDYIQRVLAACSGNRTLAAQHLEITRQTLTRRLDEREE